jgi:hypothetical protein
MCSQVKIVNMGQGASIPQKVFQCDVSGELHTPFPTGVYQAVTPEDVEASNSRSFTHHPREGGGTRAMRKEFVDEEDMIERICPEIIGKTGAINHTMQSSCNGLVGVIHGDILMG